MAHTLAQLYSHLIFSTKDRVPHLDADLKPKLFAYLGGILNELHARPILINGPADHVHMLVATPATLALSEMMRIVKTNSSKWVHETWPNRRGFGWQTGYGAFSVSHSNVRDVERYIARQEEHHRRMTFQEEYVAFLNRHGIEYDERYLWG